MLSLFEETCRKAVLRTLDNNIPVRNLQHKYSEDYIFARYAFDHKINNKCKGRVDIGIILEYPSRTETICIECKSGVRDLQSGCGLNFCGDINYIIYPKDAGMYIQDNWGLSEERIESYLFEKRIFGIGILELDEDEKIRFVKRAYRQNDPFGYLGLCTEFGDY